jgi:hypothetical protein
VIFDVDERRERFAQPPLERWIFSKRIATRYGSSLMIVRDDAAAAASPFMAGMYTLPVS